MNAVEAVWWPKLTALETDLTQTRRRSSAGADDEENT